MPRTKRPLPYPLLPPKRPVDVKRGKSDYVDGPYTQIVDREDLNEPVGYFSNKFGMKTNNHATNLFKFPQSTL